MSVLKYNQALFYISLLFTFFSCIITAVKNIENNEEIICIPNATFHIDCNRCTCSPSGMSIDCTNWTCATLKIPHDILLNVTMGCRPGEIFLYNWYKCLCSKSGGEALCSTGRYELARNLRANGAVSIISLAESPSKCTPGVVFKNGCDTCICREDGIAGCLGIGCINVNGRLKDDCYHPINPDEKVCVPYSSFSVDCNQCVCSMDGTSLACDSFPCLGVEMRNDQILNITFHCEAKSTFLYNEYECWCSNNGKYALCSLTHYDKSKEFHDSNKKVYSIADFTGLCTPGVTFKEDCNVCICAEDEKAACTRIDCEFSTLYSSSVRNDSVTHGRIILENEIWTRRKKNSRFCKNHYESMYCRYLRSS